MVDVIKSLYEVLGGKILRHEVIRDGVVIDVRPEDLVSVVKGITEGVRRYIHCSCRC
jgi:hypothetical protein